MANEIGESDLAVLWLGLHEAKRANVTNLVVESSDADVWVAALVCTAADHNFGDLKVHIHRPATHEFVDIRGTVTALQQCGSGIDPLTFGYLFALCGCDFTSGIAGFTHESVIKAYITHQCWIEVEAKLIAKAEDSQLTFNLVSVKRLFCAIYFEKTKGNAQNTNYRVNHDDAEGLGLDGLLSHEGTLDLTYTRIQRESTMGNARETMQLPKWSAVHRHARRAQWAVTYWYHAIDDNNSRPYRPRVPDPLAKDNEGVAGWILVEGQVVIDWDEGVHAGGKGEQVEKMRDARCRCAAEPVCRSLRCPCRKAERPCSARCKCQGPSGDLCRGLGCGCDEPLPPPAKRARTGGAAAAERTDAEAYAAIRERTDVSEDEDNLFLSSSDEETVEGRTDDVDGAVSEDDVDADASGEEEQEQSDDADDDERDDHDDGGSDDGSDDGLDDDDEDGEGEEGDEVNPLFSAVE